MQSQQLRPPAHSDASSLATTPIIPPPELTGNQQIIDLVTAKNIASGPRQLNPRKTGIVYMGMNEFAPHEASNLSDANPERGVAAALPQVLQDTILHKGTLFELCTIEGAAGFAATLGLADQCAVDVAQFILDAPDSGRDELCQLIVFLSEAELGERNINRMVLSGHSGGSALWGDDNGDINFSKFGQLFKLFPKAAAQVDHLMMSACYGGGEAQMARYQAWFPQVASLWAYTDSSPGTWTGAMEHMNRWEGATEKSDPVSGVDPSLARSTRKAGHVATWNKDDGYQGDEPIALAEIEYDLVRSEPVFQSHLAGEVEVANPQSGPLRDYYNLLQRALAHVDLSGPRQVELIERRDVTLRLLFFERICAKFQEAHSELIAEGYQERGLEVPLFEALGRKGVLAEIEVLDSKNPSERGYIRPGTLTIGALGELLDLLQRGLRDLRASVIPNAWI